MVPVPASTPGSTASAEPGVTSPGPRSSPATSETAPVRVTGVTQVQRGHPGSGYGSGQLLRKASATLWPPNPKELFSAATSPSGRSRALVGDVEADVLGVVEVDRRRHRRGCGGPGRSRPTPGPRRHRAGDRSSTWWR